MKRRDDDWEAKWGDRYYIEPVGMARFVAGLLNIVDASLSVRVEVASEYRSLLTHTSFDELGIGCGCDWP